MGTTFRLDEELVAEHRRWLMRFAPQYGRNWERLLKNDPEAAACEAAVRKLLVSHGAVVDANEDLTGAKQAPDFRCSLCKK